MYKRQHTGLTHCKNIEAGKNRIVQNGVVYEVVYCNPESRLTNLLLEVIIGG